MPWNVRLEDENGEVLEEVLTIFGFIPKSQQGGFVLLSSVDPYGDTTFNRPQMQLFLDEWQKLENAAKENSQLEKWNAVKVLSLRCQSEPHTYLKFVGD